MNPMQLAWDILLKGVALPDDAIGPFEDPYRPDVDIYHAPGHIYSIDKETGIAPDNPEDSEHEFNIAPWWSEVRQGYHSDAGAMYALTQGRQAETWQEVADLGGPDEDEPHYEERRQAMLRALGMEDGPPTRETQPLRGQTTVDHWLEREHDS